MPSPAELWRLAAAATVGVYQLRLLRAARSRYKCVGMGRGWLRGFLVCPALALVCTLVVVSGHGLISCLLAVLSMSHAFVSHVAAPHIVISPAECFLVQSPAVLHPHPRPLFPACEAPLLASPAPQPLVHFLTWR
jgi:hypothetical protein